MNKETEFSRLRVRAGLSVKELAELSGFSSRTIYRWDRGEREPRAAAVRYLQGLVGSGNGFDEAGKALRIADLFAGIGGMRRGFESVGASCVFSSEWDRFAQRTYSANFNCDHEFVGDISAIDARHVPEHDVLLAGFPCQPFSIAGVSKKKSLDRPHGFNCDIQGTLFFDIARILRECRPHAFLLENVKHLLRHDRGRTFEVIKRTLIDDLKYQVHWKVLDAKCWVPQHRERVFIVGFREPNGFTFDNFACPNVNEAPSVGSVLHPEDGSEPTEPPYTIGETGEVSQKYTLSDRLWNYLQNYAKKHRAAGNGFGFGLVGKSGVTRTLSARYYKDGSEILIKQESSNPRRLTPRECARIMGFDQQSGQDFLIPVSDTQAYKQFGNAVVVQCVEAVARHMAPWLRYSKYGQQILQFPLPIRD